MTEWREVTIEELAEKIAMGPFGSDIKVETFKPCGVPIISGKHLHETRMRDKGFNFISEEHADKLSNANVFRGDVIFTHAGNIGQVSFIPENSKYERYVISQRQFYLRCNSNVLDYEFIAYYFKSPYGQYQLLANANQTGVPSLAQPVSYLKSIKVLLPPLTEQKAIAEVLSSLDDKIDLLTRQNKTLEDLAQAYFRKWFIEDIHNKICYKRFADVAEFSKGKKPREIIEEQRKGYVRQILIDTFDTDKEYYTRPEGMIISTETDILMVMDGASSGRVEIGFSGVVGSTIGMFRPKSDFKYPMFLYEFLKSNEEFIMDNTTGSAIPHADKKLIFELEIPYFQEEKIQEFENFALVLFNKRQNNRRQIRTLTKLRDTLLPKLISGEIRVKM